jgi:hypothetical protein
MVFSPRKSCAAICRLVRPPSAHLRTGLAFAAPTPVRHRVPQLRPRERAFPADPATQRGAARPRFPSRRKGRSQLQDLAPRVVGIRRPPALAARQLKSLAGRPGSSLSGAPRSKRRGNGGSMLEAAHVGNWKCGTRRRRFSPLLRRSPTGSCCGGPRMSTSSGCAVASVGTRTSAGGFGRGSAAGSCACWALR